MMTGDAEDSAVRTTTLHDGRAGSSLGRGSFMERVQVAPFVGGIDWLAVVRRIARIDLRSLEPGEQRSEGLID